MGAAWSVRGPHVLAYRVGMARSHTCKNTCSSNYWHKADPNAHDDQDARAMQLRMRFRLRSRKRTRNTKYHNIRATGDSDAARTLPIFARILRAVLPVHTQTLSSILAHLFRTICNMFWSLCEFTPLRVLSKAKSDTCNRARTTTTAFQQTCMFTNVREPGCMHMGTVTHATLLSKRKLKLRVPLKSDMHN